MRVLASFFVNFLFLYGSVAKKCKPEYFWRPFNSQIPSDAFIAGLDSKGDSTYVAKITPLDQYLWTTPTQLYSGQNFINFAWHGGSIMKVDKFIHILCTDNEHTLQWVPVKKYPDEIINHCCLVEAGIGKYSDSPFVYIAYVGRKIVDGVSYVGRVYNTRSWDGVHVMVGSNSTKFLDDFEVLSYGCNANYPNIDFRMNTA